MANPSIIPNHKFAIPFYSYRGANTNIFPYFALRISIIPVLSQSIWCLETLETVWNINKELKVSLSFLL